MYTKIETACKLDTVVKSHKNIPVILCPYTVRVIIEINEMSMSLNLF